MGNKFKLLLLISCFIFLGLIGFSNKVEAAGCYTAHTYPSYPGARCYTWTDKSAYMHSCVENQSYYNCNYWYDNGSYCWGPWYDISCDSSNCGDTVTCSVCGNTVTCPACSTSTPTPTGSLKSCGESGCNSAPSPYCTSGNICNANVCQKICGAGYTRSGNCTCVPNATSTPTPTLTPVLPKNCGESGCNSAGCTAGLSCNSDVCQINCGAGYTRSGNCGCVPIPLTCGVTGCNTFGCTAGNTCNANVCQINCGAGYTRSGNCACVPVPLACGVAGCNTYGCTAGNTCNANVCQVNCFAGYSRSGNCACAPDPLACGTVGCNSFGCSSGNTCNANVCQVNCSAGYSRSGNCACVPIPLTCGVTGCNTFGCTTGNTCNANVCQVNCSAGYSRSGNCACVPIPLTCGVAGCNTFGCTAGNTCNANVCQVNCPAGHTITNNCNCLPPCSTLSTSFNQNLCSLDIAVSGASAYLTNLSFSGPPVSTITTNSLYKHTLTSAGLKSWTLNWQEVASVGVATPRSCSTTISYNINPPSCGAVNMVTAPNPLIWGETARLNAAFTPSSGLVSTLQTYSLISSVHSNFTSCSGDAFLFPPNGENCTVSFVPDPKTYPWTITWQTASKVCPSVVNSSCSRTTSFTATDKPSYLKTVNGFSYFGNIGAVSAKNSQPYFNTFDSFSSSIFGSLDVAPIDHMLPCTGNAVNCTIKDYLLMGYADKNSNSSWYSYLENSLITNPKVNLINWLDASPHTLTAVIPSTFGSKVNVVVINGDFTATGLCSNSNIFLINGNLNITPNLTIVNSTDACLFIVSGTTSILSSGKATPACNGVPDPHINLSTTINPPNQDKVQAFIITKDFTTNASTIQLYIKGGVITNTFNSGLNRKVNTPTCLYPNLPSELIDYEGARYIKNLRDALTSPTTLSIFETQYKVSTQ